MQQLIYQGSNSAKFAFCFVSAPGLGAIDSCDRAVTFATEEQKKQDAFISTTLQLVWDLWSDFKSLNLCCYKLNQYAQDKGWGNEWDTSSWKPAQLSDSEKIS